METQISKEEYEYNLRAEKYGYTNCIREYDGFDDNMNLKLYSFKALWPETNRKRTSTIRAVDELHAKKLILESGFCEPIEINRINYEPVTENQLSLMQDKKMFIPKHFCKEDATAIISNYCDDDGSRPNPGLVEFAKGRNLDFSYYAGKRSLYNIVFSSLSCEDRIAFFIFSIYRYYSDDREANLDKSPHKNLFYAFAAEHVNDKKFVDSMNNNYIGEDLRVFGTLSVGNNVYSGSSTNTIAFNTAKSYLKDTLSVKFSVQKQMEQRQIEHEKVQKKSKPNNQTIMWLLLIFCSPIGIIYMWFTQRQFTKNKKIILTVIFCIWFLICLFFSK